MKKLIFKSIGLYLNTMSVIAPKTAGRLGFNLFCRPSRVKITTRQSQYLHTADLFKLEHNGELIQGYKWGTGSTNILMLHGWQSHTYRWKAYIEALDKNVYTIYAFDAPGHGLSSGKFMNVLIYSEIINKIMRKIGKVEIVIAHSLGSFAALYTFSKNPHLLPDKLIATAPPGNVLDFFQLYKNSLSLSERTMRVITEKFILEIKKAPGDFSAEDFSRHLNLPGLIIHDEEDDETPVETALSIHKAWKNSKLILTKGTGHNLKSREVVNHVINFIREKDRV